MFLVPPAWFVRSPHMHTCYYYQDRGVVRLTTVSREGYSQALPGGVAVFLSPRHGSSGRLVAYLLLLPRSVLSRSSPGVIK